MTSAVYTQNETNFLKKVDDFTNFYKQYGLTQNKQITFEKLKLTYVQAEQQFKFMEIEYGACNENTKQELSGKFKQHKQVYADCQKKLKEIQLDLEKQPTILTSSETKKQQPSQITGLNKIMEKQGNELINTEQRLLDVEDTSITIVENLRIQKQKLIDAVENTKELREGVRQTERYKTMIKNRETYNKGILMSLVCILTIGNILIIYYKFVN